MVPNLGVLAMSILRTGIVLGAVIMLLPTDEHRKAQFTDTAGMAMERSLTFCERNPATCAAGSELWGNFVRKAEFGMTLATGLARDYMARGREPAPSQRSPDQRAPVAALPAGGASNVRSDPVASRGTLSRHDREPQWRGAPAR